MDAEAAAKRWAETWRAAWLAHNVDAIVELYSDEVRYYVPALREPYLGRAGVREYVTRAFADEKSEPQVWFGEPVVGGPRAAVEWWGILDTHEGVVTLAGTTLLRFDADGLCVNHRDFWNEEHGSHPPPPSYWKGGATS